MPTKPRLAPEHMTEKQLWSVLMTNLEAMHQAAGFFDARTQRFQQADHAMRCAIELRRRGTQLRF